MNHRQSSTPSVGGTSTPGLNGGQISQAQHAAVAAQAQTRSVVADARSVFGGSPHPGLVGPHGLGAAPGNHLPPQGPGAAPGVTGGLGMGPLTPSAHHQGYSSSVYKAVPTVQPHSDVPVFDINDFPALGGSVGPSTAHSNAVGGGGGGGGQGSNSQSHASTLDAISNARPQPHSQSLKSLKESELKDDYMHQENGDHEDEKTGAIGDGREDQFYQSYAISNNRLNLSEQFQSHQNTNTSSLAETLSSSAAGGAGGGGVGGISIGGGGAGVVGAGDQPQVASSKKSYGTPHLDACSEYGLTGLLSVIRMTDPDLNTLALGTDLTTLGGLNLNSTEVLYPTFASPWSEQPSRKDPDYVLPYCYYMQPPALKTSHLSKFQLETLFYIFYNMPKDTLQVYAAKELYNRGWKYHKEHRLWITRSPTPPETSSGQNASTNTKFSYVYFDITTWEKCPFRDPVPQNATANSLSMTQPKFMLDEEVQSL